MPFASKLPHHQLHLWSCDSDPLLLILVCESVLECMVESEKLKVGSGSLSSPMREHRNFAQFYCISVTNFSTVSECILLEIIWIKGTILRILMVVFMFACNVPRKIASWFSTGGICRLSGADHAVRDLNENSWCVYPLGDKAIRVLHSNMWYHWIGNWMPIPVV